MKKKQKKVTLKSFHFSSTVKNQSSKRKSVGGDQIQSWKDM